MHLKNVTAISRKHVVVLFLLYGCVLFYVVFFTYNRYRGDHSIRINYVPVVNTVRQFYEVGNQYFWDYYISYWGSLFANIILMLPFGFLYKCLCSKKSFYAVCLYGLLLSVSIELSQLLLRIGVCDIDDVILNVMGVAAGAGLYQAVRKKRPDWFAGIEQEQQTK